MYFFLYFSFFFVNRLRVVVLGSQFPAVYIVTVAKAAEVKSVFDLALLFRGFTIVSVHIFTNDDRGEIIPKIERTQKTKTGKKTERKKT